MARDVQRLTSSSDPEVRQLLAQSVALIEKAEVLYAQLTEHQHEMAGFLRRAEKYVTKEDPK